MLKRSTQAVRKLSQIKMREVEIAALAGILLWNEGILFITKLTLLLYILHLVSNMRIEGSEKIRSSIFAEIHNDIVANYGLSKAGIRFGSLLNIIHDITVS
jgi:hypothetical protein